MKATKALLATLFLVALAWNMSWGLGFEGLPSPIYGGDFYYSMGCVQHVLQGGNPFVSCHLENEPTHYFPLYPAIVAIISILTGTGAITAMWIASVLFNFAGILATYFLLRQYTTNRWIAAAFALIFVSIPQYVFKGTHLENTLMVPLFFLALTLFYKNPSWKNTLLLGIIGGLNNWTITYALPLTAFMYAGMTAYFAYKYRESKDYTPLLRLVTAGMITLAMALIIWGPSIGDFDNRSQLWLSRADTTSTAEGATKAFFSILKSNFLNFGSISKAILTLSLWLSLLLWWNKRSSKRTLSYLLFTTALIMTYSYLFFRLINIQIFPSYLAIGLQTAIVILGAQHLSLILKRLPYNKIISIAIFLLVVLPIATSNPDERLGRWLESAKSEPPAHYRALQEKLSDFDAKTIVTTKELGFAVNAFTGAKVLANRQAHNSPFTNTNERELAQAIILYGNNDTLRMKLVDQYNISHLYWDAYWMQSEYTFSDGKMTNMYDPLFVLDSAEARNTLNASGVKYFAQTTQPDPAERACEHCAKWQLLFILPARNDMMRPWHPSLDDKLEQEWMHSSPPAALYKIKK